MPSNNVAGTETNRSCYLSSIIFQGAVIKISASRASRTILLFVASSFLLAAPVFGQSTAKLYKERCAVCHGADGKGDTPVGKGMHLRALDSPDVQKMSDKEMTEIIADGKNAMPAYKDKLSAEQIKDLVGYIRAMAKKE
jgi:cytochrome c6